jgi:hypothetical protein
VRFRIDPWDVEYGASVGAELAATEVEVNLSVELPTEAWRPIGSRPDVALPSVVLFVDGVRRIDARLWIEAPDGEVRPGVCASYAAGVVRCAADEPAGIVHARVARSVFSASPHVAPVVTRHGAYEVAMAAADTPEALWLAIQQRMGRQEIEAAETARRECGDEDALVVVDGPLTGRQHVRRAVGVVKSHGVAYLPPEQNVCVATLAAGERTPLFTIGGRWARHSWYLRLPGGDDAPWAGVVRVECSADLGPADASALADSVAALLPRYASEAHKDARAPQNLYPIAGLERDLRHRLGDARILYRALRRAAAETAAA